MPGCSPVQKFIFPDPIATAVTSVTSEGGPCIPEVVSGEDNCGSLLPTISGTPDDDSLLPIQLQLEQGGNEAEAGFTIVDLAGTAAEQGMNDAAFNTQYHTPFSVNNDPNINVRGTSATYHKATGKLIVVGGHETNGEIRIRRQEIPNDLTVSVFNWTDDVDFDPLDIGAPPLPTEPLFITSVSITEAPDGNLLLFYTWHSEDLPSDSTQIACLKSTDGGDTWSLLHERINDAPVDEVRGVHCATSGSWVRVVYVDLDADEVRHVSSATSGLSWNEPVDFALTLVQRNAGEDESPWSLTGTGGGQFVLVHTTGGGGVLNRWTYAVATADGAFRGIAAVSATFASRDTPADITGIGAVAAFGKLWVFIMNTDAGGSNLDDQLQCYFQEIDKVQERGPGELTGGSNEWQPIESLTGMRGTRFFPQWLTGVNACGRHIFLHGALWDEVGTDMEDGTIGVRMGDISPKPLGEYSATSDIGRQRVPLTGQTADWWDSGDGVQWCSPMGRPAGSGSTSSPDTDWTEVTGGAPTISYRKDRLEIDCDAVSTAYYEISSPATTSDSWIVTGSVAYAVVRINSGSSHLLESHLLRATSRVPGGIGTDEVRFELRMGTGAIILHDVVAAADRFSLTIDMTTYSSVRIGIFRVGSSNIVQVSAWNLRDPANTFVEQDSSLNPAASAIPEDELRFGCTAANVAGVSNWREVGVIKRQSVAERELLDVDESEGTYVYLPIPALRDEVCLGNGLSVMWGGGAGAVGDTFDIEACHLYAAENVIEQSCVLDWRSGGDDPLDPQEMILEVGGGNSRAIAEYLWFCGLEEPEITVTLSNDPTFVDGSTGTPVTLDTRVFSGLEVLGVQGNILRIVATPNIRLPINGELAGLRLIMVDGAAAGTVWCIDAQCGNDLRLTAENKSNNLAGQGISGGDTFDIFLPFGFVEYDLRRRYIRLELDEADTCTGDHRLGVAMFGCCVDVPIPLEWTHNDDEESDVQIYEGEGGISWAYQRGPERRRWVGRIVGDYIRWRESFRYLLRSLSSYAAQPIVIIPDDENMRSAIYGRFEGASGLENAFWWNQDDGDGEYRFPGGDMAIRMLEVK